MKAIIPFFLFCAALTLNITIIAKYYYNEQSQLAYLACIPLVVIAYLLVSSIQFFLRNDQGELDFEDSELKNDKLDWSQANKIENLNHEEELLSENKLEPMEPKAFASLAKSILHETRERSKETEEPLEYIQPLEKPSQNSSELIEGAEGNEENDDFEMSKPKNLESDKEFSPDPFVLKSFQVEKTKSALESLDEIVETLGPSKGKSRLIISNLPFKKGFTLMDFITGLAFENQILCMGVAEKTSFIPHSGKILSSFVSPLIQYFWLKRKEFDEIIFHCDKNEVSLYKPIVDVLKQRVSYEMSVQRSQESLVHLEDSHPQP